MPINPDDLILVSRGGSDYKYPADSFQGPAGETGQDGEGVPVGGAEGQVLAKQSSTSFDTTWHNFDTANLKLSNPITLALIKSLPDTGNLTTQEDLNNWFYQAILEIESGAAGADPRLPYALETNRTPGNSGGHAGGEIWLVDGEDNYSNVTFTGQDGISTSATGAGIEISGADIQQSVADLSSDIAAEVADIEIELDDHQHRLDGLELKVDSIEGVVGVGEYELDNSNTTPRDGDFVVLTSMIQPATTWDEAQYVSVNTVDKNGSSFDFDEFVVGDVVRIHKKGDAAMELSAFEFKINGGEGTSMFTVGQVIRKVGAPVEGDVYTLTHLSSYDPSGLATIDYVDAQDNLKLNLTGGVMTGNIQFDEADAYIRVLNTKTLRITGSDGDGSRTFMKVQNTNNDGASGTDYKLNLYHLAEPESAQHAATKNYVDTQLANINLTGDYLPLAGGEMTGNIIFKSGAKIKADSALSTLQGRGSIQFSPLADRPLVIDSGSTYKSVVEIFGYDDPSEGKRKSVIQLYANGTIGATNNIVSESLFKSTRSTGYCFEAKNDDTTTTAYIHSNGKILGRQFELNHAANTGSKYFKVYGRAQSGTESTDFLHIYRNGGGTADALNYNGRTLAGSSNVATCKYVDDTVGSANYVEGAFKITNSGGNYYVEPK